MRYYKKIQHTYSFDDSPYYTQMDMFYISDKLESLRNANGHKKESTYKKHEVSVSREVLAGEFSCFSRQ